MTKPHLVVVGSGPAGIEAALEGAALGAATTMVVAEGVGGNAVLHSLIPSKVMIAEATARRRHTPLGSQTAPLDWSALGDRVSEEQRLEQRRSERRLAEREVTLLSGQARVRRTAGGFTVVIDVNGGSTRRTLRADAVIGATGSLAVLLEKMVPDGHRVLLPRHLPGSSPPPSPLAVLGGGIAGVEFATALVHLGIEVILVADGDRILPNFSTRAATVLSNAFAESGGQLVNGFSVEEVQSAGDGVVIRTTNGQHLDAAAVLVNLGRLPVLEPFADLTRVGNGPLRHSTGFALCGDAASAGVMTEGAARRSGRAAARLVLDAPGGDWDPELEPRAVFSQPAVAAFGPRPDAASGALFEQRTVALAEILACRLDGDEGEATALFDRAGALVGFEAIGESAVTLTSWAALFRQRGVGFDAIEHLAVPTPNPLELFDRLMIPLGHRA